MLRDCPLGGGGPPVALALLHAKIGAALVDLAPTAADPADRFRRALDARRFPAIFGGYPPIVRVVLPEDRLPDLGHVLSAKFRSEPPLALEGGDAWVRTACAALEAAPAPADAAPSPPGTRRRRDVPPWHAALLLFGAAASGAALAAAVAMPPRHDPGSVAVPARMAAATAPRPALPPPGAATAPRLPPSPPEPAPDAGSTRPAPAADATAGADAAFAAVPQEFGDGAPAPMAAPGEHLPGPAPTAGPSRPVPFSEIVSGSLDTATESPPLRPPARAAAGSPGAPSRAAPRSPPPVVASAAGGKRCRDIIVRTTLEGGLSNADKDYLRRGCQSRN